MRAAPAIQVQLRLFGVWQVATLLLLLAAELSLGAWLVGRETQDHRHQVAVLMLAVALLPLAYSLVRTRTLQLGWDGQGWTVQAAPIASSASSASGVAPTAGDITVAVDLGLWMLLRFHPHAASRGSLPQWLPVQRRGIEAQWHGLRCAIYSPRARAGSDRVQG